MFKAILALAVGAFLTAPAQAVVHTADSEAYVTWTAAQQVQSAFYSDDAATDVGGTSIELVRLALSTDAWFGPLGLLFTGASDCDSPYTDCWGSVFGTEHQLGVDFPGPANIVVLVAGNSLLALNYGSSTSVRVMRSGAFLKNDGPASALYRFAILPVPGGLILGATSALGLGLLARWKVGRSRSGSRSFAPA